MEMTESDDVVALWRLQHRYADVVSRRAWGELDRLFLPDTVVHLDRVTAPPLTLRGPAGLAEFVGPAMARFDHLTFVILNAVVELDAPDAARGRMFTCEVRHDPETDSWPNAHGLYQDSYRRVDGRWWFSERHYRSLAREGVGGAVLGLPADLPPLG